MRYWWVNQNQTYQHEVPGNYLWSPKRRKDGRRHPFYEFMREVSPGDIIFSFADTLIRAIGIAASHAYEAPKPMEFGNVGAYWEYIGWRIDVRFIELQLPIRPSEHMNVLQRLLPDRYSPLQPNGNGNQVVYLTHLGEPLAGALVDLLGAEARDIVRGNRVAEERPLQPDVGLFEWEAHELERIRENENIPETTRKALVLARRGQGLFKQRVMVVERACRITGVRRLEHLRASHCKPWRDANDEERLDGENGLLLTPNADHLFDRGFIAFDDNGDVLISPVAHQDSLARMGLQIGEARNVGRFTERQKSYLQYHRESVFLRAHFLTEY